MTDEDLSYMKTNPEELKKSFDEAELRWKMIAHPYDKNTAELIKMGIPIRTGGIDPECYDILVDPNLFLIIDKEFDKKIVGEVRTRKAIFLSLCYIWVDGSDIPINTIITSESSAGKSYICKQVYNLFPATLKDYRTKVSAEAFTYWHNSKFEPDWTWDGKICYLEDIRNDIINSDAFKIMCSEGSTSTIVIKNQAVDIKIKGKPCILITTARTNPTTEILNRFNLISLDESIDQTRAITRKQAEFAMNGINEGYNEVIIKSLGFLKRRMVIIPYAPELQSYLEQNNLFDSLRLRRDFPRLLDLIKCSTVLHQYQRDENEKGYLIATRQDYEIAKDALEIIKVNTFLSLTNRLKQVLGYCKELSNQEEYMKFHTEDGKEDYVLLKGFTAMQIHSKYPIINQKSWYTCLDQLCERSLLTTSLNRTIESKKMVTYYKYNENRSFNLPSYEEIINCSKCSKKDHTSLSTTNEKLTIFTTITTNDTFNNSSISNSNIDNEEYISDKKKKFTKDAALIGLKARFDFKAMFTIPEAVEAINAYIEADQKQIEEVINLLKRSGDLYEPKPGFLRLLE